jgi:hypothetical protein
VLGCEDGSAAIRTNRFLFLRQVTQAKIEQLVTWILHTLLDNHSTGAMGQTLGRYRATMI